MGGCTGLFLIEVGAAGGGGGGAYVCVCFGEGSPQKRGLEASNQSEGVKGENLNFYPVGYRQPQIPGWVMG